MNVYDFIEFLIDHGLITPNIEDDNDEGFDNRLKIQKYVLIAKCLGIKEFEKYYYDIYIYGPYSSALADEYYKYRKGMDNVANIPKRFGDRFLEIVKGKDTRWLEIASTALHINELYKDKSIVEKQTIFIKGHRFKDSFIKSVINELEKEGLLITESR
jgi:uncharacterized protein YwgA